MGKSSSPPKKEKKPRVILDTNVLIRAMTAHSDELQARDHEKLALRVLTQCLSYYDLCFSDQTFGEFHRVALNKSGMTERCPSKEQNKIGFIGWVKSRASWVTPVSTKVRCRDQKDQMFLSAAMGASAAFLVSSDADLLVLKSCKTPFRIIDPLDFILMAEVQGYQRAMRSGLSQR